MFGKINGSIGSSAAGGFLFFLLFTAQPLSFCEASEASLLSAAHTITIKKVELKNDLGRWIKIIEPDRVVDLSREEAIVSFFNNAGRVPEGKYVNFSISYLDSEGKLKKILSKDDFSREILVRKGSFVRVSFNLLLEEVMLLKKVLITTDEDEREFPGEGLIWS